MSQQLAAVMVAAVKAGWSVQVLGKRQVRLTRADRVEVNVEATPQGLRPAAWLELIRQPKEEPC